MVCNPLCTPVTLTTSSGSLIAQALIDTGSAGNFISGSLCQRLGLRRIPSPTPFSLHSITGHPLTRRQVTSPVQLEMGLLHKEALKFLILEESTADLILGRPWLLLHSPSLSWETGEVTRWGPECSGRCLPVVSPPTPTSRRPHLRTPTPARLALHATTVESPNQQVSHHVPSQYKQYADVFCPQRASCLPPHRPEDSSIELLPGVPVPRGRVYPLALPERKAMEDYVEEAL